METANPKPDNGDAIFSGEIRPHRSLSHQGFLLVMVSLGGLSFVAGLVFLSLGAWPVISFLGLDVALVWWAFRANYKAARAREIINVSPHGLLVRRVNERGIVTEWRLNPYWVRLQVDRDEEAGITCLALSSHGRRLNIAHWLSPLEKAEFAQALGAALSTVRRGAPPVH